MSYGACTLNCGNNKGNVKRASCKKCGLSGLCETCLELECPAHRPASFSPRLEPFVRKAEQAAKRVKAFAEKAEAATK